MSEVVERLAQAIYANDLAWDHMLEKNKERFRRDARRCLAELSAMGLVVVNGKPLERIQKYVAMREAKPLVGLDDQIHGIHTGTEWEAELLFSDLKALASPKVQP